MPQHPSGIEVFKQSLIRAGLSRPSRYVVTIEVDDYQMWKLLSPRKRYARADNRYSFQPESLTLPQRSFVTVVDDLFGPKRNVPVGNDYGGTVVMVFPVSDDQLQRSFFEAWMDNIVHPVGQHANYTANKTHGPKVHGSMTISTLNMDGYVSSSYFLEEIYPKEIIPVNMGFSMINDYTKLQVVFEYRRYEYKAQDKHGIARYESKDGTLV